MDHDLYFTTGPARFRFRLGEHGITLGETGLIYRSTRGMEEHAYVEVAAVGLSSSAAGTRSGVIGNCTIRFRDGSDTLVVSNCAASGLADRARKDTYRRFVADLHGRLVTSDAIDRTDFRAGYSQARHRGLVAGLILAGVFFLILPLLLLLWTRDVQALWVMLCGLLLVVPAAQLLGPNRPRSYDPRLPPDLLR